MESFVRSLWDIPIGRAFLEGVGGILVLGALTSLFGPYFGLVTPTSGYLPLYGFLLIVYVTVRGIVLTQQERNEEIE
jgi:hypothetical protein